jgi:hypothetical protein
MTQMRAQITTPYGVTTRDFPDHEQLVVTNIHGDTWVSESVLSDILDQLPVTSTEAAATVEPSRVFGYDAVDVGERESVFTLAWPVSALGVTTIATLIITASYYDDDCWDLPDGVEFGESYMYSLTELPFEVVVEDVTGQLYDEVKAGEA